MCLNYDAKATVKFVKTFKKLPKARRFGYKIVTRDRTPALRIRSKIVYTLGTTVFPEPYVLRGDSLKKILRGDLGGGGIHVFIKKPCLASTNELIIKVSMNANDIIAVGKDNENELCALMTEVKVLT